MATAGCIAFVIIIVNNTILAAPYRPANAACGTRQVIIIRTGHVIITLLLISLLMPFFRLIFDAIISLIDVVTAFDALPCCFRLLIITIFRHMP